MKNIIVLIACTGIIASLASCSGVRIKEHDEWKKYFDEYGVDGCFEMYDNNKEIASYYNKERCSTRIIPASTFKIFNSLVALQTDVAPDEQLIIKWDGIIRPVKEWNQDLTMAQAFKYSAVPYYQELARRIGKKQMQHYLDTVQYGNMQIGDHIDQFWLNGTLRISPDEQVGFIKKLYHTELPFNERAQRIVRGMMLQEDHPDYRLYYKTGWGKAADTNILWIVGYIEQFERLKNVETQKIESIPHPYFFALNFSTMDTTKDWTEIRLGLLKKILAANGLGQ